MAEMKSLSIPNFVKAGSPNGLRRQMLLNNARLGAFVNYHCIEQVSDGKKSYWIAWYMEELQNNDPILTGAENGAG